MLTRVQSLRGRSARRVFSAIFCAGGFLCSAGAAAHDALGDQIAAITREIAADPDDARLYLRRGELHRLDRELPAALADYSRARRLDPGLAASCRAVGGERRERPNAEEIERPPPR